MKHLLTVVAAMMIAFGVSAKTISKAQAVKIVKKEVPNGKIVSIEKEKEEGKTVWSFDINDGKRIREVWVDVNSGKVIHNEEETGKQEAKEKAEDEKHKKHKQ